jgi:hypothetical protein
MGGCVATQEIRPADIPRLDGYRAGTDLRLETLEGGTATLSPRSTLSLQSPEGRMGGRFASIDVREGLFRGQTIDGRTVTTPLSQIGSADVSQVNVGGTVFCVIFGALVVVGGAFLWAARGQSTGSPGRALRIDRSVVAAPCDQAVTDSGWQRKEGTHETLGIPTAAREMLASYWTENARAEHASVPAFSRLSLTLVALGAPAQLVEGAHRAALQEIDHARLTFDLAARYSGRLVAVGPIVELRRAPAVTAGTLEELAAESLVDGCLLEGIAAATAAESLERVRDEAVRKALVVVARDEREHAELAWAIVKWCCFKGGSSVLSRVRARARHLPEVALPKDAPRALHETLIAHGWPVPETWRRTAQEIRREVAFRVERECVTEDESRGRESHGDRPARNDVLRHGVGRSSETERRIVRGGAPGAEVRS